MFPLIVDTNQFTVALIGNGGATLRRLKLLDQAQAKQVIVYSDAPSEELKKLAGRRLKSYLPKTEDLAGIKVIMIADFDQKKSEELYMLARSSGALVNVEDKRELCDFHVPAIVRRGDLLLTVSTNAASPRLARRIRQLLEAIFPHTWAERVAEIGKARQDWKSQGKSFEEVAKLTDQYLTERNWLDTEHLDEALQKVEAL